MKIAGWVVTGIIVLLIAGLAFVHFSPGYGFSIVRSGSMVPTINVGDIIITRPASGGTAGNVKPGTIVMYTHDSEFITHRVISVSGTTLVTKGDANEHSDPWPVPVSTVQGIYLFRIPYLGYAVNFIQTKLGWFLAIIIPSALIIGWFVKDILKEAFKDDKKAVNNGGIKPIAKVNDTEHPAG